MFWRTFIDILRNPTLLLLHAVLAALVGLAVGVVFHNVDLTLAGVQNRLGAVFFVLAFFGLTAITTVDLLLTTRQVVRRELKARYHGSLSWFCATVLLDNLLLRVIPTLLFTVPLYMLMGLRVSGRIRQRARVTTSCRAVALVASLLLMRKKCLPIGSLVDDAQVVSLSIPSDGRLVSLSAPTSRQDCWLLDCPGAGAEFLRAL